MTQRLGVGQLTAELLPVLYQRTQGNPLFLVAMVDDLVQQDVLREGAAGWERTTALDIIPWIGLPHGLSAWDIACTSNRWQPLPRELFWT